MSESTAVLTAEIAGLRGLLREALDTLCYVVEHEVKYDRFDVGDDECASSPDLQRTVLATLAKLKEEVGQ